MLIITNTKTKPKTKTKVKRDQDGHRVLSEQRDYLGALVDVERADAAGRPLPGATDAELAVMTVSFLFVLVCCLVGAACVRACVLARGASLSPPKQKNTLKIKEEELFDEDLWVGALLAGLRGLEAELPGVYDAAAPCFPPSWAAFDAVFQMYHVLFAQALDGVGAAADALSTKSQLALMEWVSGYQETLRGLGVEEVRCVLLFFVCLCLCFCGGEGGGAGEQKNAKKTQQTNTHPT